MGGVGVGAREGKRSGWGWRGRRALHNILDISDLLSTTSSTFPPYTHLQHSMPLRHYLLVGRECLEISCWRQGRGGSRGEERRCGFVRWVNTGAVRVAQQGLVELKLPQLCKQVAGLMWVWVGVMVM